MCFTFDKFTNFEIRRPVQWNWSNFSINLCIQTTTNYVLPALKSTSYGWNRISSWIKCVGFIAVAENGSLLCVKRSERSCRSNTRLKWWRGNIHRRPLQRWLASAYISISSALRTGRRWLRAAESACVNRILSPSRNLKNIISIEHGQETWRS
jgi:hypothetical protein